LPYSTCGAFSSTLRGDTEVVEVPQRRQQAHLRGAANQYQ
jgi:hypothetical protein